MYAKSQSEPAAEAKPGAAKAPAVAASHGQASHGQWVEERPAPGLARGKYPWPAWGVATLGGVIVALGLLYLAIQLRRLLRR